MAKENRQSSLSQKERLRIAIFGVDTPAGKAFDVFLLIAILSSVVVIMLESIAEVMASYGRVLFIIDWSFSIIFTIEYGLRIWTSKNKRAYIFSFYGIIDLLSILPAYLSLIFIGSKALGVVRALRLLRVFRVLKLMQFLGAADQLGHALKTSRQKIIVFLFAVIIICMLAGTLMYTVEGRSHGFTSIPRSIYWSVVTLTTVGYGDISPQTSLGQFIATFLMITGYGIIAVPTGLVTAEIVRGQDAARREEAERNQVTCPVCHYKENQKVAKYCANCGSPLPKNKLESVE